MDESPKKRRRHVFAKVRESVLALAHLRTNLAELVKAPIQELTKHIDILGSAFVVDSVGIAATAHHVIEDWFRETEAWKSQGGAQPRQLFYLTRTRTVGDPHEGKAGLHVGRVIDATRSGQHDIALLRMQPVSGYSPVALPLAAESYEEGDEVAICGWPFGLELHQDQQKGAVATASFTSGIVSAVLPNPGAAKKFRTVFQVAAMINGGNSGGPVFDPDTAEVLGVVTIGIETANVIRADLGSRDPVSGKISSWKPAQVVELSAPSGIARAVPVHLLADQIEVWKKRTAEKGRNSGLT